MIRTRTLDEVLLMVKERQGASSARMRAQEDWKGAAKKRAEVGSAADLRCNAFTDVQVGAGVGRAGWVGGWVGGWGLGGQMAAVCHLGRVGWEHGRRRGKCSEPVTCDVLLACLHVHGAPAQLCWGRGLLGWVCGAHAVYTRSLKHLPGQQQ
jgi:hypothetical protein